MNRYKYLNESGEHCHTLDGKPLVGTSSVCKILAKPLSWYGAGKAVEVFGCPDPKVLTKIRRGKATEEERAMLDICLSASLQAIKLMNKEDFRKMIDEAYRAHDTYMRSRAKEGTDLHAELEQFVNDRMVEKTVHLRQYSPQIHPFIEWSVQNVKRFLWAEGHCYSEKHWLGGICDAGYVKHDGRYGIMDFKSAKEAYPDHFWQCAGYDIQISENGVMDADGNTVRNWWTPFPEFTEYAVVPFGAEKVEPRFYYDTVGAREVFLAMLLIYNRTPTS